MIRKSTLSYGALLAQHECVKKQIKKENLRCSLLKQETDVQQRVICQLKKLMSFSQTFSVRVSPIKCVFGHEFCKIDHKRHNFVNPCPICLFVCLFVRVVGR